MRQKKERLWWVLKQHRPKIANGTIVFILLAVILIIGLQVRTRNVNLAGYLSEDAWWHYRHVKEVVEYGHRLNPDIYEFATLGRRMTYPPLFHYAAAFSYKLCHCNMPLVTFTHYFVILEALLYILLIYLLSCAMTNDRLFSLIGALAAALAHENIISTRAGELMPFVMADLFCLTGLFILLNIIKNIKDAADKKSVLSCIASGVLFGLGALSWSGAMLIYLPLALFVFLSLILSKPELIKTALGLLVLCFVPAIVICLPWYLPIILKHGINPHIKEMAWFMEKFTALRQKRPISDYITAPGISVFFVPIVFLVCFFRKSAVNIFFIFWALLAAAAACTGWRGYVATIPAISAIAISMGLSWIVRSLFKEEYKSLLTAFFAVFLLVAGFGYGYSRTALNVLNPGNPNEVRSNRNSIKMLKFLKTSYPKAIAIDHFTWMSEDEAIGSLRMVAGQYLEYLPAGSGEALKDVSRLYLADEEGAYKICQKYNVDLIIVRKQLPPRLAALFVLPELRVEDYFTIMKVSPGSKEIAVSITSLGMQTLFFQMLNSQKLKHFELVYTCEDGFDPVPFAVVYKVKK